MLPRDLHRLSIELDRVADLGSAAAMAGVPQRMRPSRSQWPTFQALAEKLETEGAQAVLYPSAARWWARCLCVFEAGLPGLSEAEAPLRVIASRVPPRGMRT